MTESDRTLKSFIARRPLLTYVVLSYAFFWFFILAVLIILGLLRLKLNALPSWLMPLFVIFGSWMPSVAAVIVTGTLDGRPGIGKLFRKFIQFRIAGRWYLAALIPFGLAFAAAGIYRMAGGVASGGVSLELRFWIALIVVNLLQGATGEEPGWRGFALPRLLERYSPLKAGLILGIIWNFWHVPLWFISGYSSLNLLLYCLFFSIGVISLSVLMTWIFCKTSQSLVPMVITHFSDNTGLALVGPGGIGLGPTLPLVAITYSLVLVTAIVVWAAGGLSVRPTFQSI